MSEPRAGIDTRKQAVSIRMNRSDIRHIKRLAERLGARDSDVIRFAIKLMLARLSPLQDLSVRGRNLVPVFLEASTELVRHFDLDAAKLASIINDGAEPERRVDIDDIQLIAMSAIQRSYLKFRVAGLRRDQEAAAPALVNGGHAGSGANGSGNGVHGHDSNGHVPRSMEGDALDQSLQQYLYEKYLFARTPHSSSNPGGEP